MVQLVTSSGKPFQALPEGILIFTFKVEKRHNLCPHRLQSRSHTFANWAWPVYLPNWRPFATLNWRIHEASIQCTLFLLSVVSSFKKNCSLFSSHNVPIILHGQQLFDPHYCCVTHFIQVISINVACFCPWIMFLITENMHLFWHWLAHNLWKYLLFNWSLLTLLLYIQD